MTAVQTILEALGKSEESDLLEIEAMIAKHKKEVDALREVRKAIIRTLDKGPKKRSVRVPPQENANGSRATEKGSLISWAEKIGEILIRRGRANQKVLATELGTTEHMVSKAVSGYSTFFHGASDGMVELSPDGKKKFG